MRAGQPLVPDFPALDPVRARRYGAALAAAFLLLAAGVALFDFAVDPFQQYRRPVWYEPHYYRPLQRHITPGMAKHYDYDIVITGSSLMENYRNGEAGAILGGKVVNLAMGAMTAWELRQQLQTILAAGRAKHILFDINFNAYAGSPAMRVVTDPFPLYLYDDNPWNDYRYLLQGQTLRHAVAIVTGWNRTRDARDPDHPWYWAHEYEFSTRATTQRLDLTDINHDFHQQPRTLAGMQASFAANLLPLLRAHPDVRFSLLLPPLSMLVWQDFRQRGQFEVTLAFARWLHQTVKDLPNVALYDFQARTDWITNLDNYKDIYHFSPAISKAMIEAVARGEARADAASLAATEATLRTLPDYRPASIR